MFWKKVTASLFLLILISLLLAPHSLDALPSSESDTRGDAAHFPAFLLLTTLIFFLLPATLRPASRIALCAIIAISVAAGTEWIQSFTPGRMASLHDLIANLLGIAAALSGIWIWKKYQTRPWPWQSSLHATLTITIAVLLALPYFQQLHARHHSQQQFPLLSDFHDASFALLWKTQNGSSSTLTQSSSPPRLEVTLPSPQHYTGINFLPGPQDWSPYASLHLTLHNPGSPFPLGIRIDDDLDCSQLKSRFNDQRSLQSGENHLAFDLNTIRQSPQNRELKLSSIRRLLLFTQQNPQTRKFSIVKMWLE
ncbi:MAG: VanZ family protein [Verrucomicrobiales bacterium]|nr:VanZ family protein [Verrucomicrobiales bacterium]